jgi:hypothetical protein
MQWSDYDQAGTLSGRSSDNVGYNGQVVGRDPDPNVRSEIRRDFDGTGIEPRAFELKSLSITRGLRKRANC